MPSWPQTAANFRWPIFAAGNLPSSTLQTLVRRELVRIEERPAEFRLGGIESSSGPSLSTNRNSMPSPLSSLRLGDFIPSFFMASPVRARQPSISKPCSARLIAASRPSCWSRKSASRRKWWDCSTPRLDSAWLYCTPPSRPRSAPSSGAAFIAARRLSSSAHGQPSSRPRPTLVSSSSTKNTTRATSRKKPRGTTRAMWP